MITYRIDLEIRDGDELRAINLVDTNRIKLLADLEIALGSSVPVWITLIVKVPQLPSRYAHGTHNIMRYLMTGDRSLLAKQASRRSKRMNFKPGEWDSNGETKQ